MVDTEVAGHTSNWTLTEPCAVSMTHTPEYEDLGKKESNTSLIIWQIDHILK